MTPKTFKTQLIDSLVTFKRQLDSIESSHSREGGDGRYIWAVPISQLRRACDRARLCIVSYLPSSTRILP